MRDIERALARDYSGDPATRALQLESQAHIEVQRLIEARLAEEPAPEICTADFIRWIHREFYERLPDDFRVVKSESGSPDRIEPGEFRKKGVSVGRHGAPWFEKLPEFMARFGEAYEPAHLAPLQRVIASAASHHRLAWIHPFLDGNGRVARLFTHAYLIKTGLDGHRLWMVSRGFAKFRDNYMSALAAADSGRHGDLDGRGNLSAKELGNFCTFFLQIALDQVEFMASLLDLDSMHFRLVDFADYWCRETRDKFLRSLATRIGNLLSYLFHRGQLTRMEAASILGIPERTARNVVKRLLAEKILASDGPHRPLRLGFPISVTEFYFPKLYPAGVALDFKRTSAE